MPSDPSTGTTPDPQESGRPGAPVGPDGPTGPVGPAPSGDDMLIPFGAPMVDEASGEGNGSSDVPPSGNGSGNGSGAGGRGRGRRRRARSALRPLWWSMPVVVVMALASVFLTGLHVWSAASVKAYQSDGFDRARSGFEGQLGWTRSGPEAWVADYNLGSTLLVQGYLDVGVAHLERAMETVPRATEIAPGFIESYSYECRVRTNLALGIEGQGDVQVAALQFDDGADLYERSAELLAPCGSVDNSQAQSGGGQSGDPQSGGGGGQSGEPQSGGGGGQSGDPQSGGGGGQSGEPQSGGEGGEPQSGDQGDSSAQPSPNPSGGTGSAEPSPGPSGQQGSGQEENPAQDADSAKDRLEGKARDARERAEGKNPSQPSQGPSPQPSTGPSGSPTPGPSSQPSPGSEPSGEPTDGPSASPTPDPFGNETEDQRRRREELERQLEQARGDQGDTYDKNRPGNPSGGW